MIFVETSEEYKSHGKWQRGDKDGTVEINSLDELMTLIKDVGSIVIDEDKIIIYDNMTPEPDKSQEIIKSHPKAELRILDTGGKMRCGFGMELHNQLWKELRYAADYVIFPDLDEFLYFRTGTKQFLEQKFPFDE